MSEFPKGLAFSHFLGGPVKKTPCKLSENFEEQTYLCADLQQLQVKAMSSSTAAPCATRPMATTAQALGT